MSILIRRVAPDAQHPVGVKGGVQPWLDMSYAFALREREWESDLARRGQHLYQLDGLAFDPAEEPLAEPEFYRPDWAPKSMIALQLYETVSEGTPAGPMFFSQPAMRNWLVAERGHLISRAQFFIDTCLLRASYGSELRERFILLARQDPEAAGTMLRYSLRMSQIAALRSSDLAPILSVPNPKVRLLAIQMLSILDQVEPPALYVPARSLTPSRT